MSLLANSNAIEDAGYKIQRSLRFRSSASAYLNRTPASSGNLTTWTWSGWVKRGVITSTGNSFFGSGANNTNDCWLEFSNATDCLDFMVRDASTIRCRLITTQVFRDPSAWYHLVLVWNSGDATASNRAKLYINGVQVISFSTATYPAQNTNSLFNSATTLYIARARADSPDYLDGYLAEVNFIDGQALTPSSFGQTDAVTGVWTPKKYTGTYGTNGFYLDFKDNTSATTLAYDKSGNSNNWTPNNISTTAGATYDSMTDVPTQSIGQGNGSSNYAVLNPIGMSSTGGTLSGGNLNLQTTTGTPHVIAAATMAIKTKSYCEFTISSALGSAVGPMVIDLDQAMNSSNAVFYIASGTVYAPAALTGYPSFTNGDTIGIAYDPATKNVWFAKNGTWISGDPVAGTGGFTNSVFGSNVTFAFDDETSSYAATVSANFGQRPFSYTPPTGFKALNTFNLPDPVIKKPNQYMDATLYTGNGSTQTITNAAGFQPDLVWAKVRSTTYDHALFDSVRGATKQLSSNTTGAEATYPNSLTAFNSNGFSVGSDGVVNGNTNTFVGWQWKKGATPGFDIVTYTGNGSTANNVSHSLGVAPKMVIVKPRNQVEAWNVYHESLGNTKAVFLHLTNAATTSQYLWNNTSPTSSVFTVSTSGTGYTNQSGINYVAYLFAEIPQFSKAFSFTGNGSADGSFVHLGFKPKLVLLKCSSTTGNWYMFDTVRNTYNVLGEQLYPNLSNAGSTVTTLDALSNGIKLRLAGDPNSAQTYIGFAWADVPFKFTNAF